MSLFKQFISSSYRWIIWQMDESEEQLLNKVTLSAADAARLSRLTAPHRRQEWLSVRLALAQLVGMPQAVFYHSDGSPYSKGLFPNISISHTKGYVSVIASSQLQVGIDIEQYGQRIHKISSRFMRGDEISPLFHGEDTWALLLHWSAKETMFKCLHEVEVDLLEHLQIMPFNIAESGCFQGREYRTNKQQPFKIDYCIYPDFVLTYTAF